MFLGRYETVRLIASGGMGTVHLGRVRGEGGFSRRVAIKVMHPHLVTQPGFVDMLLDEARLAARIHHPNVVATLDVVVKDSQAGIVMELVRGPTVRDLLARQSQLQQKLPLPVVVRILGDTLRGLHAAHEMRDQDGVPLCLVHRDVTPQNILVGMNGVTKLTDFGVAQADARLHSTHEHTVKGKLGYIAPEQIDGATIDRRCDVYSAGVVLWEMLTGGRLFGGDRQAEIVARVLAGPRHRPSEIEPTVPPAFDEVCMRALASTPAARHANAADFAASLEAALQSSFGVQAASFDEVAQYLKRSDVEPDWDIHDAPSTAGLDLTTPAAEPRPISSSVSRAMLVDAMLSADSSRSNHSVLKAVGGAAGAMLAVGAIVLTLFGSRSGASPSVLWTTAARQAIDNARRQMILDETMLDADPSDEPPAANLSAEVPAPSAVPAVRLPPRMPVPVAAGRAASRAATSPTAAPATDPPVPKPKPKPKPQDPTDYDPNAL